MNTSTFSTGSGGGGGGGNQYIRSLASSVGLAGDPLLNMKISAHGEPIEITLKVVMIGDGAVGKTQIARIFTMNGYVNRSGNYQETLGCDVYSKILSLPDGIKVLINIWDLSSKSLANSKMFSNFLYSADAIVFVYDITHMGSFKKIEEWLNNVRRYYGVFFSSRWSQGSGNAAGGLSLKQLQEKGAYRLPYMALVGNKSDHSEIRAVKDEAHIAYAKKSNLDPFYVSARTGDGIEGMFTCIAREFLI